MSDGSRQSAETDSIGEPDAPELSVARKPMTAREQALLRNGAITEDTFPIKNASDTVVTSLTQV